MAGHVYVVGFLPGQGDHVRRDKFAVDLISDQRNVYAAGAGTVAFSGQNCDTNPPGRHPCYGGVVVIEHDSGYYSIYTHLDPTSLPVQGSHIEAGLAGKVGVMSDSGCRDANGLSHCVAPPNADPEHRGDHLHFAIHQGTPGLRGTNALWLSNTPVNIWGLISGLPSSPGRGPISGSLGSAAGSQVTPTPTPSPTPSPTPTPVAAASGLAAGVYARVTGTGSCLNVRESPSASAATKRCIKDGTVVQIADGPVDADGYRWWKLTGVAVINDSWAAETYLSPISTFLTVTNTAPASDPFRVVGFGPSLDSTAPTTNAFTIEFSETPSTSNFYYEIEPNVQLNMTLNGTTLYVACDCWNYAVGSDGQSDPEAATTYRLVIKQGTQDALHGHTLTTDVVIEFVAGPHGGI
jgi:hypothetical protein